MDRRDRNVVLLDGLQVRSRNLLPPESVAADPVILSSAGIPLLHDGLAVDALSLSSDPDPAKLLHRKVGNIHVQERVLGNPLA